MSQTTEIQDAAPEGYKRVQLGPKTLPVPTDWEIKRVDEITENLDRKRDPIKSSERDSGDVPYYGATGQVDSVSGYLFDEKLVLVGEDGADWSPFGGTSYIISGKSWVNNHAHVLRCTKIVEEFLSNYLDYIEMRQVISGTNRGKLNQSELNQFPVLYPPLPEQRRIADVLMTVDEQLHQTEEMITKIRELKKGLRHDLLLKGIRHQNYKHIELGPKEFEIPQEWSVKQISKVCDDIIDYRGKTPSYSDSGIPHIRNFNIEENRLIMDDIEHVSEETYNEWMTRGIPQEGDVFFTTEAPLGKAAMVPDFQFSLAQRLVVLQPGDQITGEYLMHLLTSEFMKKYYHTRATGSTVKGLSNRALQKVKILVPPVEEQSNITACLSNVDSKLYEEMEYKEDLKELKRGLMQDLLTGKVRVNTD